MRGFALFGGVAIAAGLIFVAGVLPAAGQSSTASPEQIQHWVAELGDNNFSVRQAAADRLVAAGFAARSALEAVANGSDPEVRASARRLVLIIDETEFSRKLAEFAADVDGKHGVMLPGWERFSELAGRDQAARALFVDMQREDGAVLAEVFASDPPSVHDFGWEMRIVRLQTWPVMPRQRNAPAPLGRFATLMFLGSLAESRISDQSTSAMFQLVQTPPMVEALQPQKGQAALRRLVAGWLVNCPSKYPQIMAQRLNIMAMYELAEALPLAVGAAVGDPRFPIVETSQRVLAIQLVGRYGTAIDAMALEPLLADQTPYLQPPPGSGESNSTYSVQVRDVALATMLHLTGQELRDYGFRQVRRNPQLVFDARTLGMENDERRSAAAAQWRAWAATQRQADISLR